MHSFAPFFNLKISAKTRQHFFAIELMNFRFDSPAGCRIRWELGGGLDPHFADLRRRHGDFLDLSRFLPVWIGESEEKMLRRTHFCSEVNCQTQQ